MHNFLIFMALMGTIIPVGLFVQYFDSNGFQVAHILASLFPNPLAGGFTADILISILAFLVWSFFDLRNSLKKWALLLVSSCCVGLSLSLPLYFLFKERERRLRVAA